MVEPQRKAELNGPEEDVAVQLDSEQLPAPAGQQLPGGVVPGNPEGLVGVEPDLLDGGVRGCELHDGEHQPDQHAGHQRRQVDGDEGASWPNTC